MTDLVALSLGAGVQSTTLALLAVEGVLPKPDVAIFADTGWEPRAVYEHLGRLEPVLAGAGIRLLKVAKGNLRADMLDPSSRFAALPYYTKGPCTMCDGTGRVDSLRTGPEWESTVAERVVIRLRRWRREHGLASHEAWTGKCPNCDGSGIAEGMGRRQCTNEYKLGPITRAVRELLGAAPPDFKRVPRGRVCEQWVGFSTDEVARANRRKDSQGVSYLTTRYPLLELDMSRDDCERWLRARGWAATKSACIGCPYHGNRQWRELRDNQPDEWADAVAFDAAIRKGGASASGETLNGEAFLHRSRVPLPLAPINRVTSAEWRDRQTDIFGQIADLDLEEDGEAHQCSPFGCEPGERVDGEGGAS